MTAWTSDELTKIAAADELQIAPAEQAVVQGSATSATSVGSAVTLAAHRASTLPHRQ